VLERDLSQLWMLHTTLLNEALFPMKSSDRPRTPRGRPFCNLTEEQKLKRSLKNRSKRRFTKYTLAESEVNDGVTRCQTGEDGYGRSNNDDVAVMIARDVSDSSRCLKANCCSVV